MYLFSVEEFATKLNVLVFLSNNHQAHVNIIFNIFRKIFNVNNDTCFLFQVDVT